MARKPTSRERALIVLLIIVGAAVLYFGRGGGSQESTAAAKAKDAPLPGDPPYVNVARLHGEPESYNPSGRNLFDFGPDPRRVAPPPPPPRPKQVVTPPPPPPKKDPPKPKPAVKRPPTPGFTLIGMFGPKDGKFGAFEVGDAVEVAGIGEELEEEFTVVAFKFNAAVIGYTDEEFAGQTTELEMKK